MCDEVWLDIPMYPLYQASSLGRVRNRLTGSVLTGTVTQDGYCQVNIRVGDERKCVRAHRLIAMAFIGPPPPGFVVNHLDFDRLKNSPENLMWTTQGDNVRYSARHGRIPHTPLVGEKHPQAKLNEQKTHEMRELRRQGWTLSALGKRFGVSERTVGFVVARKTWAHVE